MGIETWVEVEIFEFSDKEINDEYHRRFGAKGQSDRFDIPRVELRLTSLEASRVNRAVQDYDQATVFEIIKQYFEALEATND